MDGVQLPQGYTATLRRQFTFYHSVPRNSWYSFYRPRKDERLSRPWSHPVVLSMGPLDWESSALTTWPLLHKDLGKCRSLMKAFITSTFNYCPLIWMFHSRQLNNRIKIRERTLRLVYQDNKKLPFNDVLEHDDSVK